MSGYIGVQPVPQATQTRDIFTATAGQTSFATGGYTPQFLDVYLNGVHLQNGTDYTAGNGSDVVLTTGAAVYDVLEVVAYTTFELVSPTFSGTLTADNISDGTDTVETGYVVNGSAKAWVNLTGITTTSIRDSMNVSGLVDIGLGEITANLSSSMSTTGDYSVLVTSELSVTWVNSASYDVHNSRTSSSIYFITVENNTRTDSKNTSVTFQGDLA